MHGVRIPLGAIVTAFINANKWWIYRTEDGTWDVTGPARPGFEYQQYEFPTGVQALEAYAKGAR